MNQISQVSSELSAALALDLAADLWPEGQVFANHGVDPVYGAALLQKDWFRSMVDEAKKEWSSINNAKERIRLKSQIAVEMSIEELYEVVTDKGTPAAARVAAFKELKDLSGAAVQDNSNTGPAAPMVNIFLNDGMQPTISISSSGSTRTAVEEDEPIESYAEEVTPSNPDIVGLAPL